MVCEGICNVEGDPLDENGEFDIIVKQSRREDDIEMTIEVAD